jgi:hypothetical protein
MKRRGERKGLIRFSLCVSCLEYIKYLNALLASNLRVPSWAVEPDCFVA